MLKIPPMPELLQCEKCSAVVMGLTAVITAQREALHELQKEVETLREEIARLKKQKSRPAIKPSKLTEGDGRKQGGRKKAGEKPPRRVDRTVVVEAENIPPGSRFKGYRNYTIQELVIRSETTLYRLATWLSPEGKLLTAKLPVPLPAAGPGDHFGPELRSFILYQYFHALVTEPLLLEELREWGVEISSGELHALITGGKEQFHREKDEILRVGLRVSGHIHVDDTGARHRGKNGYVTHIGNEWFAWFQGTESKSRINFLELLRAGSLEYFVREESLTYMAGQKLPEPLLEKLQTAAGRRFADLDAWKTLLSDCGIESERHVRIATEGALLGVVLENGWNPQLAIVSDDAGQFNILLHGLCWVHAERVLAKLVGFNDEQKRDLDGVRSTLWNLYRDLKTYKVAPTPEACIKLAADFDALCATPTNFTTLKLALKRMHRNKGELLLVLERPDVPLHNNLSEGDVREYVKRRKISGATRSDDGRRARDTFASLKKTCRKLGISFWKYLMDRVRGDHAIEPLPALIEARAQSS